MENLPTENSSLAPLIMIFLLILASLGETKGATFFYVFEPGDQWMACNNSSLNTSAVWWAGRHCLHLQTFQKVPDNEAGNPCGRGKKEFMQGKIRILASRGGGVFACRTRMSNNMGDVTPLFTNPEHCRDFNFLIVAMIDSTEGDIITSPEQSEKMKTIKENDTLTLSCDFTVKNLSLFAVYWIKESEATTCLLSIINEDREEYNDTGCCVDPRVKERRRFNTSGKPGQAQKSTLTIFNITMSDSGKYFCVVNTYDTKHVWKIVRNVSVEVDSKASAFVYGLQIFLGVIGSIILIGGIMFLCWRKHSKGKPPEGLQRQKFANEMEDDCSPYAVSSSEDTAGTMTVYCLAASPGVNQNGGSSAASGETGQAVYSVVNKKRS